MVPSAAGGAPANSALPLEFRGTAPLSCTQPGFSSIHLHQGKYLYRLLPNLSVAPPSLSRSCHCALPSLSWVHPMDRRYLSTEAFAAGACLVIHHQLPDHLRVILQLYLPYSFGCILIIVSLVMGNPVLYFNYTWIYILITKEDSICCYCWDSLWVWILLIYSFTTTIFIDYYTI